MEQVTLLENNALHMTKNQYLKGVDVGSALKRLSGTNYTTVEVVIGSPQQPSREVRQTDVKWEHIPSFSSTSYKTSPRTT